MVSKIKYYTYKILAALAILCLCMAHSCPTKSVEGNLQIGKHYEDQKNYKNAYRYYTRAIKLDDHSIKAYFIRATLGAKIDSAENAIDDFTMVINLCGNADTLSFAYYSRGVVMYKKGYRSDACADWEECFNLNRKEANKAKEQSRLNCK